MISYDENTYFIENKKVLLRFFKWSFILGTRRIIQGKDKLLVKTFKD